MVFSSNVFLLLFMPVFFLVYYLTPRKGKNYVLLFASLLFYAYGAPEFIIQFIVSIIANFFLVKAMCRTDKPGLKKLLCAFSILISIGLLLFYKYGNFTMQNLNALLGFAGHEPLQWTKILLPIGISFFSFQSVTYTLDTYRGTNKPLDNLGDYALYISMFPQLIAGPIVRYCDVDEQIRNREATYNDRITGFYRFVIGLCKKILIADVIGAQVDKILGPSNYDLLSASQLSGIASDIAAIDTGTAWIVAFAYAFQIYFDFAGYSDMAIGLGRMMGFRFPENFDNPYTSKSITEFWRRWHKTLGAFIMNYLYIPLGGNRRGKGRMYLNLWLCFLISGLWHGAAWNFIVWGALHGLFICADKMFLNKITKKLGNVIPVVLTFITVTLIWVFFRMERIDFAWIFIKRLFAFDFAPLSFATDGQPYVTLIIAAIFSFITLSGWGLRLQNKIYGESFSDRQHIVIWLVAVFGFVFCLASLNATNFSPFIYFRF